jgi:hypothetical protein
MAGTRRRPLHQPTYTHIRSDRSGQQPGTMEQGVLDYVVVERELLDSKRVSMAVLPSIHYCAVLVA